MAVYEPRRIDFKEVINVKNWKIKVYTISKSKHFLYLGFYQQVKSKVPEWLLLENKFNSNHDKIGFLILHGGTEGIFSLINWWVGKNMLNTHIFLTDYDNLKAFKKISGDGLAPCVWELEIINHERISWIENVLKQGSNPKFEDYLNDTICIEI